jgi:hypothetical protein
MNIYAVPAIKQAYDAWQATITPSNRNGDPIAHNKWISEIKTEQRNRGQRK